MTMDITETSIFCGNFFFFCCYLVALVELVKVLVLPSSTELVMEGL